MDREDELIPCDTCFGDGYIVEIVEQGIGNCADSDYIEIVCPICNGCGGIWKEGGKE